MQLSEESTTAESDPYDAPINLHRLDLEMVLRGWTTAQLCDAAGIHPTTYYKMRRDQGQTGKRTKARIVRAFIEHPPAEVGVELLGGRS